MTKKWQNILKIVFGVGLSLISLLFGNSMIDKYGYDSSQGTLMMERFLPAIFVSCGLIAFSGLHGLYKQRKGEN